MTLKLTHGEQASIDLILDRAAVADRSTMPFSNSIESSNVAATGAVQQLLGLLGTMPVEEPAVDLVARTMAFIDRTAAIVHPSVSAAQPTSQGNSLSVANSVLSALAAQPQQ